MTTSKSIISLIVISASLLLMACERPENKDMPPAETPAAAAAAADDSAMAAETTDVENDLSDFTGKWTVKSVVGFSNIYVDEENWIGKVFMIGSDNSLLLEEENCIGDMPFTVDQISQADLHNDTGIPVITLEFPASISKLTTGSCFYSFYKAKNGDLALFVDGVIYQLVKE